MITRFTSPLAFCMAALIMPSLTYGQETADTQSIRALFDADQEAWKRGDGQAVLSNRHEHYFTAGVPRNNGRPDFHGLTVGDWSDERRKKFLDPNFGKDFAATLADTSLNFESRYELVRIDVNGNHAVAISRIEWAQNDTIKKVRVRSGWESLWFLRKIDGNWKFINAVAGTNSFREE